MLSYLTTTCLTVVLSWISGEIQTIQAQDSTPLLNRTSITACPDVTCPAECEFGCQNLPLTGCPTATCNDYPPCTSNADCTGETVCRREQCAPKLTPQYTGCDRDCAAECAFGVKYQLCLICGCCDDPMCETEPTCPPEDRIKDVFGCSTCQCKLFPDSCGLTPIPPSIVQQNRIVGGEEAVANSWPWQLSFQVEFEGQFFPFCGANVLTDRWIVTAAHCGILLTDVVVAGLHDVEDWTDGQVRNVDVVIDHPGVLFSENGLTVDNDIALIRLTQPLQFNDRVQPICLPPQGAEFPDGFKVFATGWGFLEVDGPAPRFLQQVEVPLTNIEDCNDTDSYNGLITDNMLCAGFEEGGRDACTGDSGGPIVAQIDGLWNLLGLTSTGFGCALPSFPGVYTKVSQFTDWIEETIKANS